MDQNHLNNFGRPSCKDHTWQVLSNLGHWFQRRCHLKKLLTDGRTHARTDGRTPDNWRSQKLTLSLCDRWANKKYIWTRIHSSKYKSYFRVIRNTVKKPNINYMYYQVDKNILFFFQITKVLLHLNRCYWRILKVCFHNYMITFRKDKRHLFWYL